jgi:peroxiredoxin
MKNRILILPIAAVVICGLCAYKLTRDYSWQAGLIPPAGELRAAPLFELYDEKKPSGRVRLAAYLGRHPIVLVFFDGSKGADQSSILERIRQERERIENAGIIVLGISTALPQENRKVIQSSGEYGVPLLSDPGLETHRSWGRIDLATEQPIEGTFFINRAGRVAYEQSRPKPTADPQQLLDRLLEGA